MTYLIVWRDGDDDGAMERRLAVREDHIAMGEELLASGTMWYGAAIVDHEWTMKWSMFVMDFPDTDALEAWLAVEPYMVGEVWVHVDIYPCSIRDPWQFNRAQSFFEERLAWWETNDSSPVEAPEGRSLKNNTFVREVECTSFVHASELMHEIARISDELWHHPDVHITNYKHLEVVCTTHDSWNTLTQKDTDLAMRLSGLFAQ